MEKINNYTPEQEKVAEQTVLQLAALPKEKRLIVAMVANAYTEGLLAGMAHRKSMEDKVTA